MAWTVSFAVGVPCAGGQHFTVTATHIEIPAQQLTILVTKPQATAPLTAQERADFLLLAVRFLLSQGAGGTNAQLKTALESKIMDLTLPGF